ncbi:hypothetical protein V8C40DRAFT_281175 [Trichoderma camerunense]
MAGGIMMSRPLIVEIPYTTNPTFPEEKRNIFFVEGPGTDKIFQSISQLETKADSFLASVAFTDEEKRFSAPYTLSSPDTRVASLAEEIIKRTPGSREYEDLMKKLFEALSRLPAAYRRRILTLLAKSNIASTIPQRITNAVTDHYPLAAWERTKTGRLMTH